MAEMAEDNINNLNNKDYEKLISQNKLKEKFPLTEKSRETVANTKKIIKGILDGINPRKIFIAGPCSVHNFYEALEYADKIKGLNERVGNNILILMRVYLEKPRTALGWKGFINDPDLDERYNIEKGLELARKLLLEITGKGVAVTTEFLDPLVCPYVDDLVSWGAVGARTTQSQIHRQMVSRLSMPVGYKNATSGDIEVAINAIEVSSKPQSYIGVNGDGKVCKIKTKGNRNCYLILRGGDSGPNYEKEFVEEVQKRLKERGLSENLIVDCSHGNSGGDYKKQSTVFKDVVSQMLDNKKITGLMLESNLEEGKQELQLLGNLEEIKKGVSITDACIGWKETEKLILEAHESL